MTFRKTNFRIFWGTRSHGVELSVLYVSDKESATQFLVVIGTETSLSPPSPSDKKNIQKFELCAANGTKIQTFGQTLLILDLCLE